MDEEPQDGKAPSDQEVEKGKRLSGSSLDQFSLSNVQSSNHNRRSLIQVMSIDGGDIKEDIYQYYLIDESKRISFRNSNNSQRASNNQSSMDAQEPRPRPHSNNSPLADHECNCEENNCLQYHCPCYNSLNQMCLAGSCCPGCVQMRIKQLELKNIVIGVQNQKKVKDLPANCICSQIQKATGNQSYVCKFCLAALAIQKNSQSSKEAKKGVKFKSTDPDKTQGGAILTCSCKKSHCLKKYCCCFAANKQCSQDCECQDCSNAFQEQQNREPKFEEKQRYSRVDSDHEIDIDQYLQDQNLEDKTMPQSMEFELPNLKFAYHN